MNPRISGVKLRQSRRFFIGADIEERISMATAWADEMASVVVNVRLDFGKVPFRKALAAGPHNNLQFTENRSMNERHFSRHMITAPDSGSNT